MGFIHDKNMKGFPSFALTKEQPESGKKGI